MAGLTGTAGVTRRRNERALRVAATESMADNDSHQPADEAGVETDGGAVDGAATEERDIDYLEQEVNLLRPSTPYMRDHLRIIWTGFVAWVLVVFGPVTLTAIAPDAMSTQMPLLEFPLHYFLIAIGGPTGALLLAFWYVRKRDQLDVKYDIEHGAGEETTRTDVAAADGGPRRESDEGEPGGGRRTASEERSEFDGGEPE